MPFVFTPTELSGVLLVTPRIFPDKRGYFLESWKRSEFNANGIREEFVQENVSFSTQGVVRGLHYQIPPSAQGKLVSCVMGSIYDVAVDIRRSSPGFQHWVARELNSETREMLYIPAGFAHGFYTLSETALVVYKVTREYDPANERGILWNDAALQIDWLARHARLSEKDAALPPLNEAVLFD